MRYVTTVKVLDTIKIKTTDGHMHMACISSPGAFAGWVPSVHLTQEDDGTVTVATALAAAADRARSNGEMVNLDTLGVSYGLADIIREAIRARTEA